MVNVYLYLLLGLVAGALAGLMGIGGGLILIPVMVFLLGFSQHEAQGTTLAVMVPPIGILAAWTYYKQGFVDLKAAGLICLGFVLGSVLGAKTAVTLPNAFLQRAFGILLLLTGLRMVFAR